jgi:hypothetical protein
LLTLIKRIIVGLVAGMGIGAIVMGIELAVSGDALRLQVLDLLGIALLLGGGLGAPVGVIVAIASSFVEYRTGWAWEWALVGAAGAALTILVLGRIQTPAALALLVIATSTGAVVERAAALLFRDRPYEDQITRETVIIYSVAVALIVASYSALLQGLLQVVD